MNKAIFALLVMVLSASANARSFTWDWIYPMDIIDGFKLYCQGRNDTVPVELWSGIDTVVDVDALSMSIDRYTCHVTAYWTDVESGQSNQVTLLPGSPDNLRIQ